MPQEPTAPPEPPRLARRPPGRVRAGLIAAGVDLARAGGPEAVVLREATRRVGVAPNAAYRHFADRDALLLAVCAVAMREMAAQMEAALSAVGTPSDSSAGSAPRFRAIGRTYVAFALAEPGLFATAFAVPRHLDYPVADAGSGGRSPLEILRDELDRLVEVGALPPARRPGAEYAVWSGVHGLAVLLSQGPLRDLPPYEASRLVEDLLAHLARGL